MGFRSSCDKNDSSHFFFRNKSKFWFLKGSLWSFHSIYCFRIFIRALLRPFSWILFRVRIYTHRKYGSNYIFSNFCTPNQRCIYPSLYAVVGGAAVLGGITQMTVCVVVMMVEITGKLSYILPLILAVTFSKWVSNALLKSGLYFWNLIDMSRFLTCIITPIWLIRMKYQSLFLF